MILHFPPERLQRLGSSRFQLHRMRPGYIHPGYSEDPGLGPLGTIDNATLTPGLVIRMHEHRNDEIVSYLWRGQMLHQDSTGDSAMLSPGTLMVMNAGRGFSHEESIPNGPVEMLQIFIRPEEAELSPQLQIETVDWPPPEDEWRLLVGPPDAGSPLHVRQKIRLLDRVLKAGQAVALPNQCDHDVLILVATGELKVAGRAVTARGAVLITEDEIPVVSAWVDSLVLVFLIDRDATYTRAGTLSG